MNRTRPGARAWLALALALAPFAFGDEAAQKAQPKDGASPPLSTPATERAPNFTLPNAQDGLTRVKWPRKKAVFLTFGEQASQVAIQAWSKGMREHFGDTIEYVGVAWLQSVPESMHPAAAAIIKTSHPEVLMDTTGSCATRYACKPGNVNAFVIAPDGTILMRIHEAMTDDAFAKAKGLLAPFVKSEE